MGKVGRPSKGDNKRSINITVKVNRTEHEALLRMAGIANLQTTHDKDLLVGAWLRQLGLAAAGYRESTVLVLSDEWEETTAGVIFERLDRRAYVRKLTDEASYGPVGWFLPVLMPGHLLADLPRPTVEEAMDVLDGKLDQDDTDK